MCTWSPLEAVGLTWLKSAPAGTVPFAACAAMTDGWWQSSGWHSPPPASSAGTVDALNYVDGYRSGYQEGFEAGLKAADSTADFGDCSTSDEPKFIFEFKASKKSWEAYKACDQAKLRSSRAGQQVMLDVDGWTYEVNLMELEKVPADILADAGQDHTGICGFQCRVETQTRRAVRVRRAD